MKIFILLFLILETIYSMNIKITRTNEPVLIKNDERSKII